MSVNLSGGNVISSIVEAMLPRGASVETDASLMAKVAFDGPTKALVITVALSSRWCDSDGIQEDRQASRVIHFVIERPTNYTKVWAAPGKWYQMPPLDKFEMLSDHDSGWRSAISDFLFQGWMALRSDKEFEGVPRGEIRDFNTIESIEFYTVEYEAVDERGYKKVLTRLEKR